MKVLKYEYCYGNKGLLDFVNNRKLQKEDIQLIIEIPHTITDNSYKLFYWEEK